MFGRIHQWGHLDLSFLHEFLNYRYFWKFFCWCIIIKHEYCRLRNLKRFGNRKLQILTTGRAQVSWERGGMGPKGAGLCLTGCSVNDWLLWPHPELLVCRTQKRGFDSLLSEGFDPKFEVGWQEFSVCSQNSASLTGASISQSHLEGSWRHRLLGSVPVSDSGGLGFPPVPRGRFL